MAIRRKSDRKLAKDCAYHRQMVHERDNQDEHEQRQFEQLDHDPTACWCCCEDCTDLSWYYTPREGKWWAASPSGARRLMAETYAGSPSLPGTSPS